MESKPDRPDIAEGDEVPPEEPFAGESPCPDCGGSGKIDDRECESCGGTGRIEEAVGGG